MSAKINITPATEADLVKIRAQLGRIPRGVAGISARCVCGSPMVVATLARLDDGSPFPTCFYLSYPKLVKAASNLEARQVMEQWQRELQENEAQLQHYGQAHLEYIAARRQISKLAGLGEVPEIENISAGGMPNRIKCLHALIGHSLSAGPGVNPIGDRALRQIKSENLWNPQYCYC